MMTQFAPSYVTSLFDDVMQQLSGENNVDNFPIQAKNNHQDLCIIFRLFID